MSHGSVTSMDEMYFLMVRYETRLEGKESTDGKDHPANVMQHPVSFFALCNHVSRPCQKPISNIIACGRLTYSLA